MANDLIASTAELRKGVSQLSRPSSIASLGHLSPAILSSLGIQQDPTAYFNARNHLHQAANFEERKLNLAANIDEMRNADQTLESISNLLEDADQILVTSRKSRTHEQIVELTEQFNQILDKVDTLIQDSQTNGRNLLTQSGAPLNLDIGGALSSIQVNLQNMERQELGIEKAQADKLFVKATKSVDRKIIDTMRKNISGALKTATEQQHKLRDYVATAANHQDFTGSLVSLTTAPGKEKAIIKMEEKEIYQLLEQTTQMLQISDSNLVSRSASLVLRKL